MSGERNQIVFEIVRHIGVIEEFPTGWRKELNLVSWNGGVPKYDFRDWSPDHMRMSRGMTLNENEFRAVKKLMDKELGVCQPDINHIRKEHER